MTMYDPDNPAHVELREEMGERIKRVSARLAPIVSHPDRLAAQLRLQRSHRPGWPVQVKRDV